MRRLPNVVESLAPGTLPWLVLASVPCLRDAPARTRPAVSPSLAPELSCNLKSGAWMPSNFLNS